MKSREELLRQSASDPSATAEYAFQLQQQLIVREQTLRQQEQKLIEQQQLLAEART